jgi:hypothetical protein
LSDILAVAEGLHELVTGLGILCKAEACFADALRPAEVRQRWRYDVESHAIAAVAERLEHLGHFNITSRPV